MKKFIISMLAAASLVTVALASDAGYKGSTVNGPTCVYATTGLLCD